ncbi:MAG: sugar phosphate isomerase/epimerase [Acidobacteriota bacterium]
MTHTLHPDLPDLRAIPRRTSMGLSADSFQSVRFSSPHRLLAVDRLMALAASVGAAGAHGGMTPIDFDWAKRVRTMKEELDMYVEIQTFLPREDPAVFEHAVRVAKEAGASSLRVVCLLGRRYEMFDTYAAWQDAVAGFHRQIQMAVPIVEKHQMRLGIENHKDWRVDQQVALLEQYSSEYLGVTLDTGNNLSVLDDPMETVEKLAPYTFNVHFKDMAVQETPTGFFLSEVPLGEGMLDLRGMVNVIRQSRPDAYFSLEMITRDPLEVPCITDKYWATFTDVNGLALSQALTRVRAHPPRGPLPTIEGLSVDERYRLEREFITRSIEYARAELGL